jgi:hypothetical protein
MRPRAIVRLWVEAFNRQDVAALAGYYAEDAVNHQVAEAPVHGREAIREMFAAGFAAAPMVCIVESLFEDGEWAILEWRDPLGLRGCGFFHVVGRPHRLPARLLGQAHLLAHSRNADSLRAT